MRQFRAEGSGAVLEGPWMFPLGSLGVAGGSREVLCASPGSPWKSLWGRSVVLGHPPIKEEVEVFTKMKCCSLTGKSHFSDPRISPWTALVGFEGSLSALVGSLESLRRGLAQPRGVLACPFGVTRLFLDVPI